MRALVVALMALLSCVAAAAAAERPHVYLVVIDGLGVDAVDPALMPRLTDPELCGGAPGEARATMPTRTNPNHATLLTGALPESHGVTGNGYWDRTARGPKPLDDAGRMEMETLFTTAAAARPARVTAAAFSKAKLGKLFAAVAPRQHAPDVLWIPEPGGPAGHVSGVADDVETMNGLLSAIATREPDLAVVNLSEVDRTAHAQGKAATVEARRHADDALGKLIDELRAQNRWKHSILIVTADHGFDDVAPTPERPEPIVDLGTRFASEGIDGVHVVSDGGVAHVYADGPRRASALAWAAAVAWREPGVADVLARVPVPGVRALQATHPEWGLEHERSGDVLAVARPGYEFVDAIDEVGQSFRGNHGSPREIRVPLVIGGGALEHPACRLDTPPTHADLGTTIAAVLGLRPTRRFDGRPVRRGRALALPLR
jgi:arylsulfatase A-like enzyme